MGEVTALNTRTAASSPCTVRVTRADHRGFIEFQFSLGDPTIFLEMTLPPAAFVEFCARHQAVHLTTAAAAQVDASEKRWRFGDETEG